MDIDSASRRFAMLMILSSRFEDAQLAPIASAIEKSSFCVVDGLLSAASCAALRTQLQRRADEFEAAKIGRAHGSVRDEAVRGDFRLWLDQHDASCAEYFTAMHAIMLALNRSLFLGLRTLEAHFARYPVGARYQRHRDRFRDDDARVLSSVLYLNQYWQASHAGELMLYLASGDQRIEPIEGRLVLFLSELEHEVLPARHERYSIAGWMRR
jgi:SM-20-related protein